MLRTAERKQPLIMGAHISEICQHLQYLPELPLIDPLKFLADGGLNIGVLQTKVNRKNEKSPAKFTRPKMGITKQAGEKSHRQPG